MASLRNKLKIVSVILILLSISWTSINNFYFTHYHIDASGNIVVHAHPYQKEDNRKSGVPSHTHSKNEFISLALIYNLLSLFTIILAVFFLHLTSKPHLKLYFPFQGNPADFILSLGTAISS